MDLQTFFSTIEDKIAENTGLEDLDDPIHGLISPQLAKDPGFMQSVEKWSGDVQRAMKKPRRLKKLLKQLGF